MYVIEEVYLELSKYIYAIFFQREILLATVKFIM